MKQYISLGILLICIAIIATYSQREVMKELDIKLSPKEHEIGRRRSQKSQPGFLKKEPIWPREQPEDSPLNAHKMQRK